MTGGISATKIDDPFKYAPPKADGDPWATILKPLIEADKIRCDSWKDEVQNLLIFAGLFSAVVTPFVIESYKFLLPDPNDAIIVLLGQIAARVDQAHNATPPFSLPASSASPHSTINPFSPSPSAVRINIFWFLSLILSLVTVLIGTIALQWLREHQSYSAFSSKEALSVLHMRSEALERWYVPHMFTALPLLLQGALVLFFAGLIDFSLPLGIELTMTVSAIVGLTLIFLAATTIIPTYQGYIFYFPKIFPRQTIPIPCPYKSPQSQAFRMLSRLSFKILSRLVPTAHRYWNTLRQGDKHFTGNHHISPYICDIYTQRPWSQFDLKWLSLRDVCHQRILDCGPKLNHHRNCWETEFPLSDVAQSVVDAVNSPQSFKCDEAFFLAAYHCFEELSKPIYRTQYRWWENRCHRRDRRSRYLQELVTTRSKTIYCSLSNALVGGHYTSGADIDDHCEERERYITAHSTLLHQDHMFLFVKLILRQCRSPLLDLYQSELGSRMVQYMLTHAVVPFKFRWPRWEDPFYSVTLIDFTLSNWVAINTEDNRGLGDGTVHNIFVSFFASAIAEHVPQNNLVNSLHSHPKVPDILGQLAYLIAKHTLDALESDGDYNAASLAAINDTYISVFESITSRLCSEISQSPSGPTSAPIPLFYFSALFMRRYAGYLPENEWLLLRNKSNYHFISSLQALLEGLRKYRRWTRGSRNAQLEESLSGTDQFTATPRFSDGWWEFLDLPSRLASPGASDPSAPGTLLADSLDNVASETPGSTWHFPTAPPPVGGANNIQDNCSVNTLRIGPIRALGGCAVAWGLEN